MKAHKSIEQVSLRETLVQNMPLPVAAANLDGIMAAMDEALKGMAAELRAQAIDEIVTGVEDCHVFIASTGRTDVSLSIYQSDTLVGKVGLWELIKEDLSTFSDAPDELHEVKNDLAASLRWLADFVEKAGA